MKIRKILAVCLSMLFFSASGCSTPGEKAVSSSVGSAAVSSTSVTSQENSVSSIPEAASSAQSVSSKPVSSKPVSSGKSPSGNTASTPKASSKKDKSDSEWVAYIDNNHNLHIKKEDGTNDKIILKDVEEAPCVAGEWVYYLPNLDEIDKIKLDGSQKAKVCSTDEFQVYNANLNIYHEINGSTSVTAEYKDGYILYKCFQLKQTEDKKTNPPSYYKLDLNRNKITKVTDQSAGEAIQK